jgi:hypothetical protein
MKVIAPCDATFCAHTFTLLTPPKGQPHTLNP